MSHEFLQFLQAAAEGNLEKVKKFFSKGDIDHQNFNGETAILLATRSGHYETVKWLIENGANANLADSGGNSPLIAAIRQAPNPYREKLETDRDEQDVLRMVKLLVEKGHANVNQAGPIVEPDLFSLKKFRSGPYTQITPLNQAVFEGSVYIDEEGEYLGNPAVVQYLLKKGADYNISFNGRTPLQSPNPKIVSLVLTQMLADKIKKEKDGKVSAGDTKSDNDTPKDKDRDEIPSKQPDPLTPYRDTKAVAAKASDKDAHNEGVDLSKIDGARPQAWWCPIL